MRTQDLEKTKNGIVKGGYFYNDELGIAIKGNRNSFGYNVDETEAINADPRFKELKSNRSKVMRNYHFTYSYSERQCESLGYKLVINRKF